MLHYRPHHFLCTLGFQGEGYSPRFIRNFSAIADRLQGDSGDAEIIQVVGDCDDICRPCPKRAGRLCQQQELIQGLDESHSAVLGLQPGDRISWGAAKQRIRERLPMEDFERICGPCTWKSLGHCQRALQDLLTTTVDQKCPPGWTATGSQAAVL